LHRDVAVEVLDPGRAGAMAPERFFVEVSRAATLKHPNIQAVYDSGQSEGLCFVAEELLEGETLQSVLAERRRIPWPEALSWGAQVARALREAHRQGLVHGALNPATIVVGPGEQVKVLGFGRGVGLAQATADGLLYIAPELARGQLDARSDVYALGAVLFRAISGRTPFLDQSAAGLGARGLGKTGPKLKTLAQVPDAVAGLVTRCLEKVPMARFRDIDELLEAIGQLPDGTGVAGRFLDFLPKPAEAKPPPEPARVTAPPPELDTTRLPPIHPSLRAEVPPSPRRRSRRSRRVLLWAAAALGVAGSALGAVLVSRGATSTPEPTPSAEVVFVITTDPPGATVLRGMDHIGVTPVSLAVPRDAEASPRVVLSLLLDGYQTVVLMVEGSADVVSVHQVLVRQHETPPMEGAPVPPAAVERSTEAPAKAEPSQRPASKRRRRVSGPQ
jgi:serine/threonine-protein kinase